MATIFTQIHQKWPQMTMGIYVTVRVETPLVYKLTDIGLVSLETHGDDIR